MAPLIYAVALSVLATNVTGLNVPGHRPIKFDDTQMDIIDNGGDPNQVLCADRPVVGSRFVRHMCYTRAQWSQLKTEQHSHTSRMLRQLNDQSTLNGGLGDATRPPGADNPP